MARPVCSGVRLNTSRPAVRNAASYIASACAREVIQGVANLGELAEELAVRCGRGGFFRDIGDQRRNLSTGRGVAGIFAELLEPVLRRGACPFGEVIAGCLGLGFEYFDVWRREFDQRGPPLAIPRQPGPAAGERRNEDDDGGSQTHRQPPLCLFLGHLGESLALFNSACLRRACTPRR